MFVSPSGPVVYVDIDSTIIEWTPVEEGVVYDRVVAVTTRGVTDNFAVNIHNVEYIRKLAVRGHVVIFWSAGGSDWAAAAAKALDMEKYVFACLSKPTYFVDDIADPKEFMGKHVFYDLKGNRTGFKPNTLAHEEDK